MSKSVQLPEWDVMLARFTAYMDIPQLVRDFYPLFQRYAGTAMGMQQVVTAIELEILEYDQKMPGSRALLSGLHFKPFIDVLIIDEKLAAEAKAYYEEVTGK